MKTKVHKLLILAVAVIFSGQLRAQVILSGVDGASNFEIANNMKTICGMKDMEVRITEGSVENFKNLGPGVIAFMQYDVLQQELFNDLANITRNTDSIKVLLSLGNEEIHLIVSAESGINYLGDFQNPKRDYKIAVGTEGMGTSVTSSIIKELTGSKWVDVSMGFEQSIQALLRGEIDGFFFVGSAPVKALEPFSKLAAHKKGLIKLIPISDNRLDGTYDPSVIKKGTYSWVDTDVPTYVVKSLLVTKVTGETKEQREKIANLLNAVKQNVLVLQQQGHQQWKSVSFNFNGIDWDIHRIAQEVFLKKPPTTTKTTP